MAIKKASEPIRSNVSKTYSAFSRHRAELLDTKSFSSYMQSLKS